MDAYVYQAALYCEDCGLAIRKRICEAGRQPANRDESTYDSDDYPKGPYPDGGGESDTPEHCNGCGVFLGNPLTQEGYRYFFDAAKRESDAWINSKAHVRPDSAVRNDWIPFYGLPNTDDTTNDEQPEQGEPKGEE